MQFKLIYRGPLPAASQTNSRVAEKIKIRRTLHPQLAELWKSEIEKSISFSTNRAVPEASRDPSSVAEHHKIGNATNHLYRFVPLVGERFGLACSLDILFMRRDMPGGIIRHGGDIDNRIKVLFDSLRIPRNSSELPSGPPAQDEDPFFCLMEDDKYVTELNVATDRLLIPVDVGSAESIHDVLLVIGVKLIVTNPLYAPWKCW